MESGAGSWFTGPRLKIKRANQHVAELRAVLLAFLQTDFYRLVVENDSQAAQYSLKLQWTRPIPPELPIIIGDAIHSLRSALDLMAFEIVERAGGVPTNHLYFPIKEDRQKLIASSENREIEASAGRAIVDLIVDTVKPYKGGNDALYALHKLDIADKHKLLIPIVAVTAVHGILAEDTLHNSFDLTLGIDEGGQLNAILGEGDIQITDHGQATVEVLFNRGQPFEGEPVLPTLHQLSQLVAEIVSTFEAHLTAK